MVEMSPAEAKVRLRMEGLRLMSEDVKASLSQPVAKRHVALQALVDESGGRMWFSNGTYCLRLCGVMATSTPGYPQAADNWLRAAARLRKKLEASIP